MTDEQKTDQPIKESVPEPKTLKDYIGLGFDDMRKTEGEKADATKDTKPVSKEGTTAEVKADKPCTDCGKDGKEKKEETREVYKILKVDGKDVPVYSEEELIALAQKGHDYTKKTQTVASERSDVLDKSEQINRISKNINEIMDNIQSNKPLPPVTLTKEGDMRSPEEIKKNLITKLGIDVDIADDQTIKLIDYMAEKEAEGLTTKKQNLEMESMVKLVLLKEATNGLGEIIKEARKDYPFEEAYDDDGNNLTGKQFIALLHQKANDPANKGRQLPDLTLETVKEVSAMQTRAKESAPKMPDNIDETWLKENHPELYNKLTTTEREKGVADYLKANDESPPSLRSRKTEVDTTSKDGKPVYENTKDAVKAWRRNIAQT